MPAKVRDSRPAGSGERASSLAVWAWVLYDFSNTIFSVSILTVFFPLWVEGEIGDGAWLVNAATAVSALLVFFTAPILGAVADLRQRRVPYLVVLTLVSVLLTALLDVAGGILVGVALFVAADLTYQSAIVFYNTLLPGVAAGRGAGRVSGYGTAAGYVGTILALIFLTFFVSDAGTVRSMLGPLGGWVETGGEQNQNAFLPTAVLYLLFSLPAFFFVPDPAVRAPRPVALGVAYRDVVSTVKNLRRYTGMGTFILATILYMDAANTAVSNMALYGREVFGMGSGVRHRQGGPQKDAPGGSVAVARLDLARRRGARPLDTLSRGAARRHSARGHVDREPGDARSPLAAREGRRVLRPLLARRQVLRCPGARAHGGPPARLRPRGDSLPDLYRLARRDHGPRRLLRLARPRRPSRQDRGRVRP